MKKGLLALAIGGLAIGTTEFSMMGVLPDLAADMGIQIPKAAHLIAIYALGVAVGAPTLVLISGKFAPKKILLFLTAIFILFNGLFAFAPNLPLMQVTRFLAGLPHGAFFGVGSVVATRLARKGKEAQAISIMFAGLTLANLLGVPVGTYIGHHFSWRWTYLLVTLFGISTFFSIWAWLPDLKPQQEVNLLAQLSYFKKGRSWLLVAVVAIGTGGLFAWISYIAPMVTRVSGLSPNQVPAIMLLVGMGMVIGNLMGGVIADAISPIKATIVSFSAMCLCLIVVHFTVSVPFMAYAMSFLTGVIAFTCGPPIQMTLINDAKGAELFAASAGQACFNLGNTLGAYFGGIPLLLGFSYATPVLVGALLASGGIVLAIIFSRTRPSFSLNS